jgi:hypothetical protein
MRNRILAVLTLLGASAAPLAAQSLFNSAGLGLPIEPLDARARSLGNVGIGLWGSALLPSDPGAAATFFAPTAVIVGQPSWVDYSRVGSDAETGTFQGNRFPLIGIGYPFASGVFTMSFGAFLDQRFGGRRDVAFDLIDGTGIATDVFEQNGSVSNVTMGYSRLLMGDLGVGFTVGRYAGSVRRQLVRDFSSGGAANGIAGTLGSYRTGGRWSYSGNSVTGGFAADLSSIARVSGSVTWSSGLDATASQDTDGGDRSFDLPLQLRLGGSAVLAPGLMVTASIVHADWSGIAADLTTTTAVGGTSAYGFGLELSRARLLGKQAPLRFGYRKTDLPFSLGSTTASESVLAGGFGLVLNETNGFILAGLDLALERGERKDSILNEKFWRASISLRVSGF